MVALSRTATAALGTLGARTELNRRLLEWSIESAAERLGVNPRTIRAIELGKPTVSVGTVFAYADLVGIRLFGLEGNDLVRARRVGEDTLALRPPLSPQKAHSTIDEEPGF